MSAIPKVEYASVKGKKKINKTLQEKYVIRNDNWKHQSVQSFVTVDTNCLVTPRKGFVPQNRLKQTMQIIMKDYKYYNETKWLQVPNNKNLVAHYQREKKDFQNVFAARSCVI